jgi:CelD/BcsL family acetyltransferase involved in cellulose biosynthesis
MYQVEHANTKEKMIALREPWAALLTRIPGAPIFLTWEWIDTWWRHFGEGRELWLLTAWNGDQELVGLAPLMVDPHCGGPLHLRRMCFLGSGLVCPCHIDIVARSEEKEAICTAFLSHIRACGAKWDILDLESTAQDCTLKHQLARARGHYRVTKDLVCPFISLPDSWDIYHKGLKKKLRRNLRYFRGRLEQDYGGQIAFHRVADVEELPSAMNSLTAMHQKRWHARNQATCFDNNRYVEFHRELAAVALEQDWLRFYQLRVAGHVIAALYCFRYQDTFYAYQIGFDLDWSLYSPGRLLIAHVIREAIEEGAHEFDWLRGGHDYKFAWTGESRTDSCLLFSTRWPGSLWMLGLKVWELAAAIGTRVLPQAIQLKIKRNLATQRW